MQVRNLALAGVAMVFAGLGMTSAGAQTLKEAMAQAYLTNPTLGAQRAALRAVDEGVPQAKAGWRPTVNAAASAGFAESNRNIGNDQDLNPRTASLTASQPLFRGFRTEAEVASAEAAVRAQRARLLSNEQTVLLQSVTAYLDVLRDQALVELNRNNEQVLRRQLQAANDRFRVGEITKTDVAQAESRLAGSTADRVQAEGNLISSRATFARVVGQMPGTLETAPALPVLPKSEDEASSTAAGAHPDIITAQSVEEASRYDIDVAWGALLPTVTLDASISRSIESTTENLRSTDKSLLARVSIPLYQAGADYSRVRQRKETSAQRRIEVEDARRAIQQQVTRSWEAYNTARARIVSRQEQGRASRIALDGVQQEALVGSRTTLDVLDAEQEFLNANVQLVVAQRDERVAAFTLLAAVGQLTAEQMALGVEIYDPTVHYNKVRDQWIGLTPGND